MLTETMGKEKAVLEKKLYSEKRIEEDRKKVEFSLQIFDSFVFIDEVKKSDEVYLFHTKMEL